MKRDKISSRRLQSGQKAGAVCSGTPERNGRIGPLSGLPGLLVQSLLVLSLLVLGLPLLAGCEQGEAPQVAVELCGPAAEEMAALPAPTVETKQAPKPLCPPEMVLVDRARLPSGARDYGIRERFCIDRYEAMLITAKDERRLSPYYAPHRKHAVSAAHAWNKLRFQMGEPKAQEIPLPVLPLWQQQEDYEPRARSTSGELPNGHVSGVFAQKSCQNAGKRLCLPGEWRLACGGEHGYKFPYGNKYLQNKCNVFREAHPAHILHDDASIGHADPRLNQVRSNGRPLLRKTGATPECASVWGEDAIYDMVGNLDEWVDEPDGVFAGGFYARSTKDGCDWRASGHPFYYADYSTGVRCCADLGS